MFGRGRALGAEARAKGVNVLLGPSMGPLGRSPLGGRNWEGFGADPVLQAVGAAATVRGIQSEGVMATAKHLVGNEQEHFRQSWEWLRPDAISANVDDRTLHELYAWPFAECVRAGVASVMCAYNQVNNSYACQNSKLLNGVLKDELGFQGFVQSDWLAQRSGVASALAGLDMSMPGDGLRWQDGNSLWGGQLTTAVLNGSVLVERLNDMVTRIVAAWYQLGQDDMATWGEGPNFSSWTKERIGLLHPQSDDKSTGVVNKFVNARQNHSSIARQIAAEGIVLVKNEDGVLPLSRAGWPDGTPGKGKFNVAVFGEDSVLSSSGVNSCPDRGCNKGTLASGWGSGAVEFPYVVEPLAAIREAFDHDSVELASFPANVVEKSPAGVKMAQQADLCIVFINSDGGEGYIKYQGIEGDRNDLLPQNHGNELAYNVAKLCGNGTSDVVVVIHSIGPVVVENFADEPNVKAILFANLPGQESGDSLADVLFGATNPSGKLPYTVGRSLADYGPAAPILKHTTVLVPQQNFSEGPLIDYRHFDARNLTPRYEFGFGLSYTTFALSALVVDSKMPPPREPLPAPRPPDAGAPPSYDTALPDPSSALFPPAFRKLRNYIYPYLTSASTSSITPAASAVVQAAPLSPAGGGPGGNPDLYAPAAEVRVTLANTGPRAGAAVVQLYAAMPRDYADPDGGESVAFAPRLLRNFTKVALEAGAEVEVSMVLSRKDFSYWCVRRQNWVLPEGTVGVEVGFSSRDLWLRGAW